MCLVALMTKLTVPDSFISASSDCVRILFSTSLVVGHLTPLVPFTNQQNKKLSLYHIPQCSPRHAQALGLNLSKLVPNSTRVYAYIHNRTQKRNPQAVTVPIWLPQAGTGVKKWQLLIVFKFLFNQFDVFNSGLSLCLSYFRSEVCPGSYPFTPIDISLV